MYPSILSRWTGQVLLVHFHVGQGTTQAGTCPGIEEEEDEE
jgi:hypothetical protein